ncbi:MAG: porin [Cellvibrionaceae bacterium]|nr:porin [Cellvibrionaceae bacterium]
MKKALLPLAIAAVLPMSALADVTVYGKANVAVQSADEKGDSITEVVSNASRVGFKGKEDLGNGLKAIYKFEYETHIDDGDKDGDTFSQRNIFVGLEGGFGQVIVGKYDTPFKKAQKKVDLFNDLEGDIKSILTKNDNRSSNQIQYTTPKIAGAIKAKISYIANEDESRDDGISTAIAYDDKDAGVYLAVAYDQDVEKEGAEALRLVGQFKVSSVQLGVLWEDQDAGGSSLRDGDGWVVSAKVKVSKPVALKLQYGQSDMVKEDAKTWSMGADYKLSKKTKLFAYYTHEEADNMSDDNDYAGVGIEMKF